jgi:hypothetical protein
MDAIPRLVIDSLQLPRFLRAMLRNSGGRSTIAELLWRFERGWVHVVHTKDHFVVGGVTRDENARIKIVTVGFADRGM